MPGVHGSSALGLSPAQLGAEAVRALRKNPLRSALTVLGVAIGSAALVWVAAVGRAGSERWEAQLQALGDDLVWIEAGSRSVNGLRTGSHGTTTLTLADAEAIRRELPLVRAVSPNVDGPVQVAHGARNWRTVYRGVSPEYLSIRRWTVAEGSAFTDDDVSRGAAVVLLGETVRARLFGAGDAVGREVRIGAHPFRVVGTLAAKGQSATGQDQDDTLIVPYTAAQQRIRGSGLTWLDDVMCSARSAGEVGAAADAIVALLRQRHGVGADGEDDFNVRKPEELIRGQLEVSRTRELLLLALAAIALVVGGIGIMNVMLVSVAERTREIGVRLAVGATPDAVRGQFLAEAVLLSLGGGVAGAAAGIAGCFALGPVLGWEMSLPPLALVFAPAASAAVGVVFGAYPAWRASRLDPIAALRQE